MTCFFATVGNWNSVCKTAFSLVGGPEGPMAPRDNRKGYLKRCAVALFPGTTTRNRVRFNSSTVEPATGFDTT
jgi:hypothetical protein